MGQKIERRESLKSEKTAAEIVGTCFPVPCFTHAAASKAADARRCLRSIGAGAARLPIGIKPQKEQPGMR
jgi:hypothetical protein